MFAHDGYDHLIGSSHKAFGTAGCYYELFDAAPCILRPIVYIPSW